MQSISGLYQPALAAREIFSSSISRSFNKIFSAISADSSTEPFKRMTRKTIALVCWESFLQTETFQPDLSCNNSKSNLIAAFEIIESRPKQPMMWSHPWDSMIWSLRNKNPKGWIRMSWSFNTYSYSHKKNSDTQVLQVRMSFGEGLEIHKNGER